MNKFAKIGFGTWEFGGRGKPKRGGYPLLDSMADKYNKNNAQIAARWLIQQDNINIVFKSSNSKHVQEILDAQNFCLSESDMQELNNFLRQENVSFISVDYRSLI